ncbi:MAG TPA: HEAT repeat domain-containing protein [Gemmataceae bacterium]|jgi:hypothetical protein
MKRWLAGVTLLGLLGAVAAGWLCRDNLRARYYARQLLAASDADAAGWIERGGEWGSGVPDRLIDVLATEDATACSRAAAALARLGAADRLAERFTHLSPEGWRAALECVAAAADRPEAAAAARQLVRPALQHADTGVRLRAAALALRPEVGQAELLVPLLKDSSAEVRRTAVLAVGPSRNLIADDDLLHWLHDPDPDVRRLTETALRSRGLRAVDVRMGRLLTDPRPAARLELLGLLRDDGQLDLSAWLGRLCEDSAPAVRAAAARLAVEQQVFQLADRLAQMAQADPDLTVRQTVRYHLAQLQAPVRPAGATQP